MRERDKIARVKKLYVSTSSIETILAFLRQEGATKIDSIRLLHLEAGIPLSEAKKAIFLSQTWSDRLRSDEEFLNFLLQDLDAMFQSEAA